MEKVAQTSLALLLVLSIFGVILFLVYKSEERERQELELNLAQTIQKNQVGDVEKVDISSLTSFSWDRMYVFAPYTLPVRIDTVLGKNWLGSRFTSIKSSDRITLLVFTKNARVVQYLEYPRNEGDFSSTANETGYSINEAQFIVGEKGQMVWKK